MMEGRSTRRRRDAHEPTGEPGHGWAPLNAPPPSASPSDAPMTPSGALHSGMADDPHSSAPSSGPPAPMGPYGDGGWAYSADQAPLPDSGWNAPPLEDAHYPSPHTTSPHADPYYPGQPYPYPPPAPPPPGAWPHGFAHPVPPSGYPGQPYPGHYGYRYLPPPPRATLILVLGILSIVLTPIIGPVAWYIGSKERHLIRRGHYAPSGAVTTGWILGIVATVLLLFVAAIVVLAIMVAVATSGTNSRPGGPRPARGPVYQAPLPAPATSTGMTLRLDLGMPQATRTRVIELTSAGNAWATQALTSAEDDRWDGFASAAKSAYLDLYGALIAVAEHDPQAVELGTTDTQINWALQTCLDTLAALDAVRAEAGETHPKWDAEVLALRQRLANLTASAHWVDEPTDEEY